MKKFDFITEADARMLAHGEQVELSRAGRVTPLAADTLRARRVSVVQEGVVAEDAAALIPKADVRVLAVASDHGGLALKAAIVGHLRGRGLRVDDMGTHDATPVDYPDTAAGVARAVARGEVDAGIVIDGAGIGSAIAANKVDGVRAVMATTETIARYSREHNGANVLSLGATLLTSAEALRIVDAWLGAAMRESRYVRRLAKIRDIERHRS